MSDTRQHYGLTLGILTLGTTAYALQQTMVVPALPELQRELDAPTTRVTKGGTATVRGQSCQEWQVVQDDSETTLCIGQNDLPLSIKAEDLAIEFYDYNAPITISAPPGV